MDQIRVEDVLAGIETTTYSPSDGGIDRRCANQLTDGLGEAETYDRARCPTLRVGALGRGHKCDRSVRSLPHSRLSL